MRLSLFASDGYIEIPGGLFPLGHSTRHRQIERSRRAVERRFTGESRVISTLLQLIKYMHDRINRKQGGLLWEILLREFLVRLEVGLTEDDEEDS